MTYEQWRALTDELDRLEAEVVEAGLRHVLPWARVSAVVWQLDTERRLADAEAEWWPRVRAAA